MNTNKPNFASVHPLFQFLHPPLEVVQLVMELELFASGTFDRNAERLFLDKSSALSFTHENQQYAPLIQQIDNVPQNKRGTLVNA